MNVNRIGLSDYIYIDTFRKGSQSSEVGNCCRPQQTLAKVPILPPTQFYHPPHPTTHPILPPTSSYPCRFNFVLEIRFRPSIIGGTGRPKHCGGQLFYRYINGLSAQIKGLPRRISKLEPDPLTPRLITWITPPSHKELLSSNQINENNWIC